MSEPTEQEKQLEDAPPADAVERLKGQLREAQENDRTGAAER
jgi:hypothetical protein